jgi:hypothetical protein
MPEYRILVRNDFCHGKHSLTQTAHVCLFTA